MKWLRWFGRSAERDRAYARLTALKEGYGAHGERIILLSRRTDLARKSAGSTQRAFDYVERAFAEATGEYARIGELISKIETGLEQGVVGDFPGAEKALQGLDPKFDELERRLAEWEATWQQIPAEIDEAERALADTRVQVERAAAGVGAPLPLSDKLATTTQFLERIRRTLAEGNPVEAGHLLADLRLALQRVSEEAATYTSGVGAIRQAEQELAEARGLLKGKSEPAGEAVAALAAAEALLPRLRPALAAGKLDQFQGDLLQIQRHLGVVRGALK